MGSATPANIAASVHTFDVIVVGGGNAALAAAISAHDSGARVLVLEAAPKEERGGNSRFAGTVFRAPHKGLEHVKTLLCEEAMDDTKLCTIGPYTEEMYFEDLSKASHGRLDKDIAEVLVKQGWETLEWMKSKGHKWELMIRKYLNVDNLAARGEIIHVNAGAAIMAVGGGVGLTDAWWTAAESLVPEGRMTLWYESPAHDLIATGDTVHGVKVRHREGFTDVYGKVVLASGGFSSNPAMRRQYLGEGWDLVLVRGTKYNMGTMLNRAIAAGARPAGHWGAAHASPQDANGPLTGDINVSVHMPRYAYTYGITVNINGERFFDEGEDDFGKTYAKTGKKIADQPEARAFQIFDQQTIHLLPKRYQTATPIYADTIQELARKMGVNATGLLKTVETFNAACSGDVGKFNPTKLDGLSTSLAAKLPFPKTNWATRIEKAPFVAYAVACGITFTYGGIATDVGARVLNNEGRPMPGLWATGEIVGGLFYHNYPGGSGLTKGAVFGRIAGREAAAAALRECKAVNSNGA
ncbi:precorrin 3B synthase CobZ [Cladophialophora bantiana CBS 173.52]|uniref:Precorrin 3B synthase CobZ n=1 Tax=Cladophialophora bantiana (strain ATCC 10958 / CBS 173.52 / CDC B-1940 / NIH 8579) TaxID=1442370 RepID=A0A0D2F260_CLAB1|nr:precorrin 3B synthase CobZ [Cladophialophora bantiana CBS 173.52]KIW96321.1 precorrin 3B synthase CobZ [Cladophialophora bantiana CBS 173.52]